MNTRNDGTFIDKLAKLNGTHITGATAAELLNMPQHELLALARTPHGPKPESVGVVVRFSVADLRQWARRGFPSTLRTGAAGSQRARSIASRANGTKNDSIKAGPQPVRPGK